MRHGNDLPQGTPRGARAFGERKDAELDHRLSDVAPQRAGRPDVGVDPPSDAMTGSPREPDEPKIGMGLGTSTRPVPEAIARWEGEGGRSC